MGYRLRKFVRRNRTAEPCVWLLDAPVSNSGRLAALIRATTPTWSAEVVPNPDAVLIQPGDPVATADAGILDRCGEWVSLASALAETAVPGALVVDLRLSGDSVAGVRR